MANVAVPFPLERPELEILIETMCSTFDTAPAVTRLLSRLVRARTALEDLEYQTRVANRGAG